MGMTLSEFKAWFEGFTELLGDTPPNAVQFSRIKEKVAKIDGAPITPIVIHEWYRPYISRPYYPNTNPWVPYWGTLTTSGSVGKSFVPGGTGGDKISNAAQLLYDLGKTEYSTMMVGNESGIYAVTN